MGIVSVELPHHRYEIMIEPRAIERLGQSVAGVAPHSRCALIADEAVYERHGGRAEASLEEAGYEVAVVTMEPGEEQKTLETVRGMYDRLLDHRMERGSPVVALGGGVCGDTAGFVAATYLRGVPFVQCPTSLLAMVDASVGGKVGVNLPRGKNLVGAFHQPEAVVLDPLTLWTLPDREMRCGLAECVKHGMIRDLSLFDFIDNHLVEIHGLNPPDTMVELLRRNVAIKSDVVAEDEREKGVRAHLNFGHTFAHAIEATTGYERFLHGEAVSLGMVAATKLAVDMDYCNPPVLGRLTHLLERIGLPTETGDLPETSTLMEAMLLDKKVKGDRVRLVLPHDIGEVAVYDDVPAERIEAAWEEVRR